MKKYLLFICAITTLVFSSCSEDTIDVVLYGSLSGKVVAKETGDPLENVKITTNPASTTVFTDSEGKFRINSLPVDDYSVQAEISGYTTGFEAVSVQEDATSTVSFELVVASTKNSPPAAPTLVSPEDGETELPLEVTFTWEGSDPDDDVLTYSLELRNGTTNEVQNFNVAQDTSYTVQNLKLATSYFWQVTVTDGENDPVSSVISEFKTLVVPDNPYIFVKENNGNLVIYSGDKNDGQSGNSEPDFNVLQLTSENLNSFRPRKSEILKRIAFLRNSGGNTQIFTMKYDGTDVQQVTNQFPVAGFRTEELSFTWAENDSKLYYPYFDKLYSVNYDGSNTQVIYQTSDGSFISEVAIPEFDNDLVLLKTNNSSGYNVRLYTARISTQTEEDIILENQAGAVKGIDISANADKVVYSRDVSGSENPVYRIFEARIFLYDIPTATPEEIETNVGTGQNDYDVRFFPSEGGLIFTRVANNFGAVPDIFEYVFDQTQNEQILFTNSFMPDWE